MRLLSSCALAFVALGLQAVPTVVGSPQTLKECYPSCTTFTDPFSGSGSHKAIDQKTPWSGLLGVDKFNNTHGARTLIGVEIKTIMYFNTSLFFTRTNPNNDFTSVSATAGFLLHMDLASHPDLLGEYWGRWGNYLEFVNNINHPTAYQYQGQNGVDVTGLQPDQFSTATIPLFVEYTYPLFDIIGSPFPNTNDITGDGTVWAYYLPSVSNGTEGWPQVFYGPQSSGIDIIRPVDEQQPQDGNGNAIHQYFTKSDDTGDLTPFTVDTNWPYNSEKQVGTTQYFDYFSEDKAFNKSIWNTDLDGGLYRNITAQSMLDLFDNQYGQGQIYFDVGATGQYVASFAGGNGALRQETYAKVAVRVEYTFLCTTCQDPQFGGFQGQSFQVHGYPGSYFNLFSAPSFQMNGRFAYLASGHCNYDHTPCWTHPGTYIDDITFVVDELLIRITAGAVASGYTVLINNEPFHAHGHANESDIAHTDSRSFVPTKFYDPNTHTTVHLKSPLEVIVRTELVSFAVHNADHFFNLDSQLLVRPLLRAGRKASIEYPDPITGKPGFPQYPLHGFIGQTWANKKYPNKRVYQGEPDDYIEPRPYATESLYSQYHKQFDDKQINWTEN